MAENWEDLRIAEQRVNELLYLWESETEEPWSQEWRLELNELERDLFRISEVFQSLHLRRVQHIFPVCQRHFNPSLLPIFYHKADSEDIASLPSLIRRVYGIEL